MDRTPMGRYWSEDADNYGRIVSSELASFRALAWKKRFRRHFRGGPLRILDFGCGPGFFSILLSQLGHRVWGGDISEGMIRRAEELSLRLPEGMRPSFLHSEDVLSLFLGESLDAIVCRNVTWTLPDPAGFYRRCLAALRPGGTLLVYDANWMLPLSDPALRERVERRERLCVERYGSTFDGPPISEPVDFSALPLSSVVRPQWDRRALREAGFAEAGFTEDVTGELWDEKERLLYGETPLFEIRAVKGGQEPIPSRAFLPLGTAETLAADA